MVLSIPKFPPFNLVRLLSTVFGTQSGQRVAILIDLDDPRQIVQSAYLSNPNHSVQRLAYEVFYQGLHKGVLDELDWRGGDLFAYKKTGGSNLDLPEFAFDEAGVEVSFTRSIYPHFDILLCISTFSATAPLTAFSKRFGFRGATLHGLNEIILASGLSVDYVEVSKQAEKIRKALTNADCFEIDFLVQKDLFTLVIECSKQDAQKSHGLCLGPEPDVANLPAGEVYFVPSGAVGTFPMRYSDGTIGRLEVKDGKVIGSFLIAGNPSIIKAHNDKLAADPLTGELGELGFGTQVLPVSGSDIQDEKILGTMHLATGRSDHLGGHLTPDRFVKVENATHEDILFSPTKTPEIVVDCVRMNRNGQRLEIIQSFQPTPYLLEAMR